MGGLEQEWARQESNKHLNTLKTPSTAARRTKALYRNSGNSTNFRFTRGFRSPNRLGTERLRNVPPAERRCAKSR